MNSLIIHDTQSSNDCFDGYCCRCKKRFKGKETERNLVIEQAYHFEKENGLSLDKYKLCAQSPLGFEENNDQNS